MKKIFLALMVMSIVSCSSGDDTCYKPVSLYSSLIDENSVIFSYKQESDTDYTVIEFGEPGFEVGIDAIGTSRFHSFFSDFIAIGGIQSFI